MQIQIATLSISEVSSSSRKYIAGLGLLCILSAVVGGGLKVGDLVELPLVGSVVRQVVLAILGVLLLATAFVGASTSAASPDDPLADAAFWRKVFEAMPPAFVKGFPHDVHLVDNRSLQVFQGSKREPDPSESTRFQALIDADHQRGDAVANKTGKSVQLELSDEFTTKRARPILTFKTKIEHGGRTYIAGYYTAVARPDAWPTSETIGVKSLGEEVVYSFPALADDDDEPYIVHVGSSIHDLPPARAGARRSAARPKKQAPHVGQGGAVAAP